MTLEELRDQYQQWSIREETNRYSATLPGWGVLYGQKLDELAERLTQWTADHVVGGAR